MNHVYFIKHNFEIMTLLTTHEFRLRDAKVTITAFKPKTVKDLATQINRG